MAKTSTLVIDHDICAPRDWTATDIMAIDRFVRLGEFNDAAKMAKLGIRLVVSEFHQAAGGTLEEAGWATPFGPGDDISITNDLRDIAENPTVATPVCRIYRGPTEYALGFPIGDDDDVYYEMETRSTEAEAGGRSGRNIQLAPHMSDQP